MFNITASDVPNTCLLPHWFFFGRSTGKNSMKTEFCKLVKHKSWTNEEMIFSFSHSIHSFCVFVLKSRDWKNTVSRTHNIQSWWKDHWIQTKSAHKILFIFWFRQRNRSYIVFSIDCIYFKKRMSSDRLFFFFCSVEVEVWESAEVKKDIWFQRKWNERSFILIFAFNFQLSTQLNWTTIIVVINATNLVISQKKLPSYTMYVQK